ARTARDLLGEVDVAAGGGPTRTPGEGTRWLKWQASPWMRPSGRRGGLVIHAVDVTHEVERGDRAGLNLALAETLLQRSPVPMVVKDHDGRVRMINEAMLDLYGSSHRQSIGRTIADIFPPEVALQVEAEDRQALASNLPVMVNEVTRALPGGERVLR